MSDERIEHDGVMTTQHNLDLTEFLSLGNEWTIEIRSGLDGVAKAKEMHNLFNRNPAIYDDAMRVISARIPRWKEIIELGGYGRPEYAKLLKTLIPIEERLVKMIEGWR